MSAFCSQPGTGTSPGCRLPSHSPELWRSRRSALPPPTRPGAGRRAHFPAWAFAFLPPATFAIQEVLELSLHTGSFTMHALLAPTFLPGLLLQLPLALAAYLMARFLLRTAERVGRALAQPPTLPALVQLLFAPTSAPSLARPVVAGCSSRGPPTGPVAN